MKCKDAVIVVGRRRMEGGGRQRQKAQRLKRECMSVTKKQVELEQGRTGIRGKCASQWQMGVGEAIIQQEIKQSMPMMSTVSVSASYSAMWNAGIGHADNEASP
jgi:hypothetical protein